MTITLRSGEEITISSSDDDVFMLVERIRKAMETFRQGGAEFDAALLQRGDREVSAWLAALRAIGAGANADLRTAPLPRERLFRIVEDPTSAPIDRAAASIALGVELSDVDRARLRSVAEATAASRLRFAIEKVADGSDEAELEEALAEIEGAHQDQDGEDDRALMLCSGAAGRGEEVITNMLPNQ